MDSHDTNQPLKQGELEEEKKAVEVSEEITETPAEETIVEKPTENASKLSTKEEVLLRLKEVAQDAENANKQELDGLKQTFYKIHNAEIEAAKKNVRREWWCRRRIYCSAQWRGRRIQKFDGSY